MHLPISIRENLVDDLDDFLEAYTADPDPEPVATYLIEQVEVYADEEGLDDIRTQLEESGALEGSLQESLEDEMSSNDEFEYTGEEIVSLLERLCGIEWEDDDEFEDEDEEEEEFEDEL